MINGNISWKRLLEVWSNIEDTLNKSIVAEIEVGSNSLGLQEAQATLSVELQKKSDMDSKALKEKIAETTAIMTPIMATATSVAFLCMSSQIVKYAQAIMSVAYAIEGITSIVQGALMLSYAEDMKGIATTDEKCASSKAVLDLVTNFYKMISKREEESFKAISDQRGAANLLINNIYDAIKEASRKI